MLLVLEVLLTISAWRKGWKSRALLPLGILICLGFFLGIAMASNGSSDGALLASGILLDIIAVVALSVMAANAPQKSEEPSTMAAEIQATPGMLAAPSNGSINAT